MERIWDKIAWKFDEARDFTWDENGLYAKY